MRRISKHRNSASAGGDDSIEPPMPSTDHLTSIAQRVGDLSTEPSFFIIRNTIPHPRHNDGPTNGGGYEQRLVPLIPADLLPEWLEVQHFPQSLTFAQTVGMTSLGSFMPPKEVSRVRFVNLQGAPVEEVSLLDEYEDQGSGGVLFSHGHDTQLFYRDGKGLAQSGLSDTQEVSERGTHQALSVSASSEVKQSRLYEAQETQQQHPDKQPSHRHHGRDDRDKPDGVCWSWCRTGVCRWGPKCRFKHKMPETVQGLADVGLTDVPEWRRAFMEEPAGTTTVTPRAPDRSSKKKKKNKKKKQKINNNGMNRDGQGEGSGGDGSRGRAAKMQTKGKPGKAKDERPSRLGARRRLSYEGSPSLLDL